jgi:hypothetical protein
VIEGKFLRKERGCIYDGSGTSTGVEAWLLGSGWDAGLVLEVVLAGLEEWEMSGRVTIQWPKGAVRNPSLVCEEVMGAHWEGL